MIRNARFRALVLLLLLALVASPAIAAGKAPAKPKKAPALVTWFWQSLARFVPGLAKGRGGMDPNGSPTTDTTPTDGSTTDNRGSMDPDGHA